MLVHPSSALHQDTPAMTVFSHPWLKTSLRCSPTDRPPNNSAIPGLKQFGYPRLRLRSSAPSTGPRKARASCAPLLVVHGETFLTVIPATAESRSESSCSSQHANQKLASPRSKRARCARLSGPLERAEERSRRTGIAKLFEARDGRVVWRPASGEHRKEVFGQESKNRDRGVSWRDAREVMDKHTSLARRPAGRRNAL